MGDINWGIELKKIEREFVGLPPAPSVGQRQAKQSSERRGQQQRDAAVARFGASARLALVTALFGALFLWPYQRECGVGLFGYMAVQLVIAAGSLHVAAYTWTHRVARVHVAAFVIFLGALGLLSSLVLPRAGYVRAGDAQKTWFCPSR